MTKCNIHISPRLSRLYALIKYIKYIKWNAWVRLKLHSAVLDLHTHVMSIQMWICWPVFPSSSLNCLFLHHCARFLFLSFSCCFLIIVSTSSPEFTGSLFLVLSPHPPPQLFVWLNGFISGFWCFRQMPATPYTIFPFILLVFYLFFLITTLLSSCFLPLISKCCVYISPSFFLCI